MAPATYRIGKKIGPITNEHHINNVRQPRGGLSREAAAVKYEDCEKMAAGRMASGARKRSADQRKGAYWYALLTKRAARGVGGMQYNHRELAGRVNASQVKAAAMAPRLASIPNGGRQSLRRKLPTRSSGSAFSKKAIGSIGSAAKRSRATGEHHTTSTAQAVHHLSYTRPVSKQYVRDLSSSG